ncbi:MAG: hypothetical protein PF495_21555 [Spirochaetales bacterium]|jgi:hypothetical protein|nr:hypothetical protein [Spirochaetales bacterium]
MALQYFTDESTTSGSLDFLSDWLKKNPKNKVKQFNVVELIAVKSNKGFLCTTDSFQVFIWRNSRIATHLVEAMDTWINKTPDKGSLLVVVLEPSQKDGYQLAVDKEIPITWFQAGKGYTTLVGSVVSTDPNLNPFL